MRHRRIAPARVGGGGLALFLLSGLVVLLPTRSAAGSLYAQGDPSRRWTGGGLDVEIWVERSYPELEFGYSLDRPAHVAAFDLMPGTGVALVLPDVGERGGRVAGGRRAAAGSHTGLRVLAAAVGTDPWLRPRSRLAASSLGAALRGGGRGYLLVVASERPLDLRWFDRDDDYRYSAAGSGGLALLSTDPLVAMEELIDRTVGVPRSGRWGAAYVSYSLAPVGGAYGPGVFPYRAYTCFGYGSGVYGWDPYWPGGLPLGPWSALRPGYPYGMWSTGALWALYDPWGVRFGHHDPYWDGFGIFRRYTPFGLAGCGFTRGTFWRDPLVGFPRPPRGSGREELWIPPPRVYPLPHIDPLERPTPRVEPVSWREALERQALGPVLPVGPFELLRAGDPEPAPRTSPVRQGRQATAGPDRSGTPGGVLPASASPRAREPPAGPRRESPRARSPVPRAGVPTPQARPPANPRPPSPRPVARPRPQGPKPVARPPARAPAPSARAPRPVARPRPRAPRPVTRRPPPRPVKPTPPPPAPRRGTGGEPTKRPPGPGSASTGG